MRTGFAVWPQKIMPILDESNCLLKCQNNRSDGNLCVCKYSVLKFAPYQPAEVNGLFNSSKLDPTFEKLANTKKDVDQKILSLRVALRAVNKD